MKKHLLKNPNLARLVADITGDGHLQIQEWRHLTSFYSKNLEEIEAVKQRFFELFGVEGRIYVDNSTSKKSPKSTKRYKLFIISKPVALFLRDIGTPVGNKTNIPFTVPKWIIKGKPEMKAAYLRGLYDTEGSIHCTKGKKPRWRISFKMAKNGVIAKSKIYYLEQIKIMLKEFNVISSPIRKHILNIRKDGSQSFEFQFDIEKPSFRNFFKYVGFEHPKKQQKLLFVLSADGQAAKARGCNPLIGGSR